MQNYQLLEEGIQIVVVGAFNPAIFHPQWFARKDLMSDAEAEAAMLEVCHSDVTKFSTDWYDLEVLQKRLTIRTKHIGRAEELRDLLASTFLVLKETPIEALGFNREGLFRASSEKWWHLVGDTLAPKDVWEGIFPASKLGMKAVEIQGVRDDGLVGERLVRAFPVFGSGEKNSNFAFAFNSHIEVATSIEEKKASDLYEIFMNYFEPEMDLANKIFFSILERIENA